MKLKDIIYYLERIAPPELAEPFDNGKIGLIVDRQNDIEKIAISLDANQFAIDSAALLEADLLITHHTPIFNPINKISYEMGNFLKTALVHNISVYTMHTNFDKSENGINSALASVLGLKNTYKPNLPMGKIGEMTEFMLQDDFIKYVKDKLGVPIRVVGDLDAAVHRVMVIGGCGFTHENIEYAKKYNVDAFVSGELSHHTIRDIEDTEDMIFIDAGHYATESIGMMNLVKLLEKIDVKKVFYIDNPPKIKYF